MKNLFLFPFSFFCFKIDQKKRSIMSTAQTSVKLLIDDVGTIKEILPAKTTVSDSSTLEKIVSAFSGAVITMSFSKDIPFRYSLVINQTIIYVPKWTHSMWSRLGCKKREAPSNTGVLWYSLLYSFLFITVMTNKIGIKPGWNSKDCSKRRHLFIMEKFSAGTCYGITLNRHLLCRLWSYPWCRASNSICKYKCRYIFTFMGRWFSKK